MADFHTINDGVFVTLIPTSPQGVKQWNLIAAHPDGEQGKIMPHHWPRLRLRLMSHGYTFAPPNVRPKPSPEIEAMSDDDLLNALTTD
jgi:hypothetical protein